MRKFHMVYFTQIRKTKQLLTKGFQNDMYNSVAHFIYPAVREIQQGFKGWQLVEQYGCTGAFPVPKGTNFAGEFLLASARKRIWDKPAPDCQP